MKVSDIIICLGILFSLSRPLSDDLYVSVDRITLGSGTKNECRKTLIKHSGPLVQHVIPETSDKLLFADGTVELVVLWGGAEKDECHWTDIGGVKWCQCDSKWSKMKIYTTGF